MVESRRFGIIPPAVDASLGYGALRTRTVARLAGVSVRQLGYWHLTELIEAHTVPGSRGTPRLYSWIDYMKIRAARKLRRQGLSTRRVRATIAYLDDHVPDWYRYPVHRFGARVLMERNWALVTVDGQRQLALPFVADVLNELIQEGPLGEMRTFSDQIDMDPDIVSGNPVVRGTRLETAFIAELVNHGVSVEQVASLYSLSHEQVERTLEFASAL